MRIKPRKYEPIFDLYHPWRINQKFCGEEKVRLFFGLENKQGKNYICVDAAAHIKDCPWIIIEDTKTDIANALNQIDAMVDLIEERGTFVERIFLMVKKLDSLVFGENKNGVLVQKLRKGREKIVYFGREKKSYVYVIKYYEIYNKRSDKIAEVEKNGPVYNSKRERKE